MNDCGIRLWLFFTGIIVGSSVVILASEWELLALFFKAALIAGGLTSGLAAVLHIWMPEGRKKKASL